MTNAIVKGIYENGQTVYYTGKAGRDWLTENRNEAFTGYSLDGARRKALQFNKMTDFHKIRFVAVSLELNQ